MAPAKFEYAQAQEIRDAFARHAVRYLFLGKSADVDFVDVDRALVARYVGDV